MAGLTTAVRSAGVALLGWWQVLHLGALVLVLAVSPSSWRVAPRRLALAYHLHSATGPVLLGFCTVSALISLVVIRIVVVTALSYGLSQYALEMVVRVLVLELIPLGAALFAALRATLPSSAEVARQRKRGGLQSQAGAAPDPLAHDVLPRVLAGMFAVALLAALSCVLTLVLAYLVVHGFTLGGFERYTRTVGRVFSPAVALVFGLKLLFFSAAVALIPMASALQVQPRAAEAHGAQPRLIRTSAEVQGLVRMLLVILVIEVASLVGNYY